MHKEDIIVLENDEKYTLMYEIPYEGERYFLAMQNINDVPDEKKIVYFKEAIEDGQYYVDLITNEDLIVILSSKLKNNLN